jgi:hypothetical protein
MDKPQESILDVNAIQFFVLGILVFIILADKIPVIFDSINNKDNYRLYDGWGDGIKDFFYFITISIVLLTMKFKKSKADFIAVLVFGLSLMLCISAKGFYKFIVETIISMAMLTYLIYSFINKTKQQKLLDKDKSQ